MWAGKACIKSVFYLFYFILFLILLQLYLFCRGIWKHAVGSLLGQVLFQIIFSTYTVILDFVFIYFLLSLCKEHCTKFRRTINIFLKNAKKMSVLI